MNGWFVDTTDLLATQSWAKNEIFRVNIIQPQVSPHRTHRSNPSIGLCLHFKWQETRPPCCWHLSVFRIREEIFKRKKRKIYLLSSFFKKDVLNINTIWLHSGPMWVTNKKSQKSQKASEGEFIWRISILERPARFFSLNGKKPNRRILEQNLPK